ncbi:hypothetical protein ABZZ79_20640 [Streptomyces sp. NPDC006458]|uniref:hypothetical protein n=1 Tax=Streptomyces sp. NPDC006458 TaxID=3154302 RepID=UPI00339DDE95
MFMRLSTSATLCLAAAAAPLLAPASAAAAAPLLAPASAAAAAPLLRPATAPATTPLTGAPVSTHSAPTRVAPACTAEDGRAFPLTTRIHGGPEAYEPGGRAGVWYVDLTNTTDRPCTGIHPVVVLADAERALRAAQPRLEFYADGRPHPVRFEITDEDELVGAFADDAAGFPGFGVGPGRTVTVKVRLALAGDAVANEVTATAAVVQRQDDDGEWVGRSNDYRFTVRDGPGDPEEPERPGEPERPREPEDSGAAVAPTDPAASSHASGQPTGPADASPPPRPDRFPSAAELARTGLTSLPTVLAAGAALLLAAGAAVLARGRGRR